ncbi:MAG: HAMP domain-containing sensor histidine kinase [Paludibacter sp.]|nr:HAMP domain-containing sensor histidine kinase [Paludibacter sp.]
MSTKYISYIAIVSIVFILLTQSYLVYDYFQTVKFALIRESDAILKEAFRVDLDQRTFIYKELNEEDSVRSSFEVQTNDDEFVDFDMRGVGGADEGFLNKFDIVMHSFISTNVPININTIDSIIGINLQNRNINSIFAVQIVNPKTKQIIVTSKAHVNNSFLMIPSQLYPLDFEEKEALQLILINPFSEILKRMGLMLLGSIIFSIISLLAFRFLIQTLAKQKKLVKFKNEFLSNIAHELKRPVSSLIVNLDCLKEPEMFDNENMRNMMLNNSVNSLTELNGTISMIVGLAKVEEGLLVLNKLPVNIVKLIDDLKGRFVSSPAKSVTLNTYYDTKEIIVNADGLMLTQCFANLIDNAIKYSKKQVIIDISVLVHADTIELNFKDNGIGIPAEKINTIFEKYSRVDNNVKVNGFGIGLNYVKTIIEKHGGSISVTSKLEEGSNFNIILPPK